VVQQEVSMQYHFQQVRNQGTRQLLVLFYQLIMQDTTIIVITMRDHDQLSLMVVIINEEVIPVLLARQVLVLLTYHLVLIK
ncbi:MAG: hypothetical protein ACPG2Y_03230, partial [Acholeplasmataceae bacterium]